MALCTYNGAPYLKDQLDSIAAQTRPPDEVVICDDNSTDATCDIVRVWAAKAPFPVRLYVNRPGLGTIKNFEQAIGLCKGDIIALSDQDDVWHPDKLNKQAALFGASPDVGLVFTDAVVVDPHLHPLGYRMWNSCRFSPAEQGLVKSGQAVNVLLRRNVVTGATLAFRSRYKALVLPIPQNAVHLHDYWIAFLIAAAGNVDFLPDQLIQYRQQPTQQVGAHPPISPRWLLEEARKNSQVRSVERHEATLAWFADVRQRLCTNRDSHPLTARVIPEIDAKIDLVRERITMANSRLRRGPLIVREVTTLRYHRYSIGMWAAIKDLTV